MDFMDLNEADRSALTDDLTRMDTELHGKYMHIKALDPAAANVGDVLKSLK